VPQRHPKKRRLQLHFGGSLKSPTQNTYVRNYFGLPIYIHSPLQNIFYITALTINEVISILLLLLAAVAVAVVVVVIVVVAAAAVVVVSSTSMTTSKTASNCNTDTSMYKD